VSLLILEEETGEHAAFDCKMCVDHYLKWKHDPAYPWPKAERPQEGVSFGCFWCGGDLAEKVEWLG
jgi:hypothetical protein